MIFLGIQPDIVGFYYPMTQPIRTRSRRCTRGLMAGRGRAVSRRWKPLRNRSSPAKRSASRENFYAKSSPLLAITFLYHQNDFLRLRASVP